MKKTFAIIGCWFVVTLCPVQELYSADDVVFNRAKTRIIIPDEISNPAHDSHTDKVEKIKKEFINKAGTILVTANTIEGELQQYGLKSKAIDEARQVIANMEKHSACWKDLSSRETQRRRSAESKLKSYIEEGTIHIQAAEKELAAFKEANFQAWARTHPKEAEIILLKKRLAEAEGAAADAFIQVQQAQHDAKNAESEAVWERSKRQEAEENAERAQRKTR